MLFDRLQRRGNWAQPWSQRQSQAPAAPGWPSPPSPPSMPPWPWRRLWPFRTYRLYPPLFPVMSTLVPPRRKEPSLSYARHLFLQLPHAPRYVNAPSAPTTAVARPGAWHSSILKDREARGSRVASGPAEAGEGEGNGTSRNAGAEQRSDGRERPHRPPGAGMPSLGRRRADHRGGATREGNPTSSVGRCGGLGRSTHGWRRGHRAAGWARAPPGPKRQLLSKCRAARSCA